MGGFRIPYSPDLRELYDHRNSRITDLLMRQGDIQAQRAHDSGQIWGNAIQNIGQQVAGGIQEHAERKEQSKRSKAFEAAIATGDPKEIIRVLGPKDGPAVVNALKATTPDGMKQYTDRMALLRDTARGVLAVPPENRQQAYEYARNSLLQSGVIKAEEVPEQYDEALLRQASAYGEAPKDKARKLHNAAPGTTVLDEETGQPVFTAPPEAPKPPNLQATPTAQGIRPFNPQTGQLGDVIGQPPPNQPREESRSWVLRPGADGKATAMRVRESDIRPGDQPYQGPQNQRLTAPERQDFAAMNYALPRLDTFTKYVEANPDKWGKWDSFRMGVKQAIPGLADEEYASQEAFITRVNAEIRHALYGASLTGGEQQSAEGFIVNKTDQPVRIVAKVKEAMSRARANVEYYRSLGFNVPAEMGAAPTPPPPAGSPKQIKNDAEYNALPSGAEYISPDGKRRRKQ